MLFKAKKRKTKNQKLIQLSDLFLEKKSKVNDQHQDFLKKPPQSLKPKLPESSSSLTVYLRK